MRKWNALLFGAVIFIFFVSFKILQPDIEGNFDEALDFKPAKSPSSERQKLLQILEDKYMLKSEYCQAGQDPWRIAADWVSDREVHPEYTPEMGCVLHSLKSAKIVTADVGFKGSQLKLSLELEGGQKVAFKPKWFERNHIQKDIVSGWDRHNGEIASFHIGRLLEFRRTPLAVGRKINLKTEVIPVATENLLKTFFNKDGNQCLFGSCRYCKENTTSLCAAGDVLEGVVILWLPSRYELTRYVNPWIRSYKSKTIKRWEYDTSYCSDVVKLDLYKSGPRLMDLIDATILDYLVGNADRHHYETLGAANDSMILLIDNGKSFGNPYEDETTILAPLYQCCKIRDVTWQNLLLLQNGVLSQTLSRVLSQDSIAPVLYEQYYTVIDRRLNHIIYEVQKCILAKSFKEVLVTDR